MISKICAIIVTYNSGKEYINNFLSVKDKVDNVIIVDNCSDKQTNDLLKQLQQEYDNTIIIFNNSNLGLATAQNIGIRKAKEIGSQWILLLDDDSKPDVMMIDKMRNFYNKRKDKENIAIIVPEIIELKIPEEENYFVIDQPFFKMKQKIKQNESLSLYFAIASGSLIKIDIFDRIGLFRDDFFIDYLDIEFGFRTCLSGYKIMLVKDAYLYHYLGNKKLHQFWFFRIVTSNHSPFRRYFLYRNRVRVWKLYIKIFPKFIIYDIILSLFTIAVIMVFEKDKLSNFRNIIKGYIDGFRS